MINIGTVWTNHKFTARYVLNLYCMLKRNISEPFNFYCLTDKPPSATKEFPFYTIPVGGKPDSLFGWWHFMEFYSGKLPTPMMYFGLDTVIRDDITDCAKVTRYTLSKDFNYLVGSPNIRLADTYADCAAVIPNGGMPWLYEDFINQHKSSGLGKDHTTLMHVWVTKQLRSVGIRPDIWQEEVPGLMTSYKWPQCKIKEPMEAMVFWHGEPMVHECLEDAPWIKDHWHSEDI